MEDHFDKNARSSVFGTDRCCDICKRGGKPGETWMHEKPNVKKADFAEDAKIVFDAINDYEGKGARTKLIKYIRGSKSKDVWERYQQNPNWGKGKNKKEEFWKDLFQSLLSEAYIGESSSMNAAGWSFSQGQNFRLQLTFQ